MAGVYVHIPFCHSKCSYCDFFSTPRMEHAWRVVDGIISEYRTRARELGDNAIETIYFGGGTPSVLPTDMLAEICAILPMHSATERTVEVNPEDITPEKAADLAELGFNRVSMGVQSLKDNELKTVGRRHSAAQALEAIDTLRAAGFNNISCDLIYGLPGQTLQTWKFSLETLIAAGIEHLSAYSLGYEPGTKLSAMLSAGKITPTDDETVAAMYTLLCEIAGNSQFEHYEISNFAKAGFRSRHNSSYWTATPYLGLGPGAHSCDINGVRRVAPCNISVWAESGAAIEEESDTDRLSDRIITGLRTIEGLDLSLMTEENANALLGRAKKYIVRGLLQHNGNRIRIPEQAWIISDGIMCDLLA